MKINWTTWRWWRIDAAGAGACAVMTLAFYLLSVQPLLCRQADLAAQKAELAAQQGQLRRLETTLRRAQGRLQAVRDALAESPLKLQPTSNVNRRLAELSGLAADCGLSVDGIQPGPAASGTHYQTVPIHLAGNGTYRTCTVFLHRLRQVFPDTNISAMELAQNAADPFRAGPFRFDLIWHAAPALPPGG